MRIARGGGFSLQFLFQESEDDMGLYCIQGANSGPSAYCMHERRQGVSQLGLPGRPKAVKGLIASLDRRRET
jgi:hypothetical protein